MVAAIALLRVLVLISESTPEPERFVELLGIQLSRIATVEVGPAIIDGNLPDKVEMAVDEADAREATVAVWIERGGKRKGKKIEFILHIVGRRQGRLMVEVFRLPARDGPDLDRTLALKVGEVLDKMLVPLEPEPSVAWVDPTATERSPTVEPAPKPRPAGLRFLAEVGARGSAGLDAPETAAGVYLAVGVRRPVADFLGEAYVSGGIDSGANTTTPEGTVDTDEIVTAVGVRLLSPVGGVHLGAQLEVALRFVTADGITPRGRTGSESVLLPAVLGSLEARWPLRSSFELRAAAGVEYSPNRLSLTVNSEPVVDLGRVRPVVQLALVFLIP